MKNDGPRPVLVRVENGGGETSLTGSAGTTKEFNTGLNTLIKSPAEQAD